MKLPSSTNYVRLQRGRRTYTLNTSDIRKIFKINKKVRPPVPAFDRVLKPLPSTDVDEYIDESLKA